MPLQQYGGSYPYTSSNKQGHTAVNDYCMAVGVMLAGSKAKGLSQNANGTTVQRITMIGLTHNSHQSSYVLVWLKWRPQHGRSRWCTFPCRRSLYTDVVLFFFRSFQKHRRARERVNNYPCSTNFEGKIESLWVGYFRRVLMNWSCFCSFWMLCCESWQPRIHKCLSFTFCCSSVSFWNPCQYTRVRIQRFRHNL